MYRKEVHTLFYLLTLNYEIMLIPSFRSICLLIVVNICTIIFFYAMLSNNYVFLTNERNDLFLIADDLKIVKLVTVFILTVFILNILIFKFLLGIKNQPIYSSIKLSTGVVFVGIILTIGFRLFHSIIEGNL